MTTSPQNFLDSPEAVGIDLTLSKRVLFIRSATHSIGGVRDCLVPLHPILSTELIHQVVAKLKTIISAQHFDLLTGLNFNHRFKVFKLLVHLRFVPYKKDPNLTRVVVYDGQKVRIASMCGRTSWTPNTGMDVFQGSRHTRRIRGRILRKLNFGLFT